MLLPAMSFLRCSFWFWLSFTIRAFFCFFYSWFQNTELSKKSWFCHSSSESMSDSESTFLGLRKFLSRRDCYGVMKFTACTLLIFLKTSRLYPNLGLPYLFLPIPEMRAWPFLHSKIGQSTFSFFLSKFLSCAYKFLKANSRSTYSLSSWLSLKILWYFYAQFLLNVLVIWVKSFKKTSMNFLESWSLLKE